MYKNILILAFFSIPTIYNYFQTDAECIGLCNQLEMTSAGGQIEGQENPFVGMAGYIIVQDVCPWTVTAVNAVKHTATVVVSSGPSAGTYTKVPYELFEKTEENDYIIGEDINPYH